MNSVHQQYIIVVPISVIRLPLRFRCWGQLFFFYTTVLKYFECLFRKQFRKRRKYLRVIYDMDIFGKEIEKTAFKSKTNLCKSYLVAIFKVIELIKVVPFARF